MTMKDMCEAILASPLTPQALKDRYPTGEDLFNYSPTGELFMLWEWYEHFALPLRPAEEVEQWMKARQP